jgi:hypothetical protein
MTTYRNFRHLQPEEDFSKYFNDFNLYLASDWTITTTEAGTGAATEAISQTEPGGVLLITNDDADDDADFFQYVNEIFEYVAGKKFAFKMRFKVSEATQSDVVLGLQITDTTPLAVTDGIYIRKDDGDANLDFVVAKNSTASTLTAFATLTADTWTVLEIYYDGGDSISVSKDGVRAGSLPLTNVPDDENLTISFGLQNGSAGAKTMSVDYILLYQER